MNDTKNKIIDAAMKTVRQYGMEGVRIQNVSALAEISSFGQRFFPEIRQDLRCNLF